MIENKGIQKLRWEWQVAHCVERRGENYFKRICIKEEDRYSAEGAGQLHFRLHIWQVNLGEQPRQTNGKNIKTSKVMMDLSCGLRKDNGLNKGPRAQLHKESRASFCPGPDTLQNVSYRHRKQHIRQRSLHLTMRRMPFLLVSRYHEGGTLEVNVSSGHVSLCKASPYSPIRPIKARKWTSSSSHSVLMCPQMYLFYAFNSSCSNEKLHVEHIAACARWGN